MHSTAESIQNGQLLGNYDANELCHKSWRTGLGVRSTGCSSRGPGFDPQHPHGNTMICNSGQMSFTDLQGHKVCLRHTDIQAGKTPVHIFLKMKETKN